MTDPSVERATKMQKDQRGSLPDLLGFEWLRMEGNTAEGRFDVRPHHLSPTGFLHAASLVVLADSASGFGCLNRTFRVEHQQKNRARGICRGEFSLNSAYDQGERSLS